MCFRRAQRIRCLRAVVDPRPPKPRASFHAALEAMEGTPTDMRDGLLDKQLVNVQRMDTVAFSVGGALFHAVALSCEQNSPVMRAKLQKVSNIYKQVIPMRSVGNLDDTSMYEVRPPPPVPAWHKCLRGGDTPSHAYTPAIV